MKMIPRQRLYSVLQWRGLQNVIRVVDDARVETYCGCSSANNSANLATGTT